MKKVIFIIILFLSCYFIYNKTINNKKYYLVIGDSLSKGINEYGVTSKGYSEYIKEYLEDNKLLKDYNKTFTSSNYRTTDIIRILSYNEIKDNYSLNRLLKKADIITISLGIEEIYNNIDKNNYNTYNHIDNIINNYEKILKYISKFNYDKVYILGYYNTYKNKNDIFIYANYKLKELTRKYNYNFVDISNIFNNNPNYLSKNNSFLPNNRGYEKISQIIVENLKNN